MHIQNRWRWDIHRKLINYIICYQLIGNFIGPSVRLADPIINFGLIRGFAQSSCTLMIENTSEVEAEVLFKNADNKEEFTGK